ncbi:ABC transporter permease [Polaromonas sp.]|uniref:ABC transporter permease n=1 Tax=Polaromonas sp. TaxID=1869339 RepID=UPI003263FB7B
MISAASLKAAWNFRGFVFGSVRRDYQLRYRGTMLGIAWTVLQPLAMILIYTLVFSHLMKSRLPGVEGNFSYSIHLCAGVITWGLFAEIIQRSQSVFLDNANLIKKLSFPRLTLPVIVVATALLNFSIVFGLFLVFLLVTGNFPGVSILAMIPLLAVQVLFAAGLGITLGVLNVFFRDAGQLSGLLLQFWFWATPIVYPASILPEWLRPWMNLNPMYQLMQGYQNIFVAGQLPDWQNLALVTLFSAGLALYAVSLFRRHSSEMVDEL